MDFTDEKFKQLTEEVGPLWLWEFAFREDYKASNLGREQWRTEDFFEICDFKAAFATVHHDRLSYPEHDPMMRVAFRHCSYGMRVTAYTWWVYGTHIIFWDDERLKRNRYTFPCFRREGPDGPETVQCQCSGEFVHSDFRPVSLDVYCLIVLPTCSLNFWIWNEY